MCCILSGCEHMHVNFKWCFEGGTPAPRLLLWYGKWGGWVPWGTMQKLNGPHMKQQGKKSPQNSNQGQYTVKNEHQMIHHARKG